MVRQHVVEELAVDDEDVVQVVQVVQVLGNQVAQFATVLVPVTKATKASSDRHLWHEQDTRARSRGKTKK